MGLLHWQGEKDNEQTIKYEVHAMKKNKEGKGDSESFKEWGSNFQQKC